ncbi:WXG100 family type VII secretion target [Mycolicibacterium sp.]|uniref:WXG100 family type VII secretion target n=1 Tax=Mycolicibacterium sp. TaxID=2320850 RepID=UPI003D0E7E73
MSEPLGVTPDGLRATSNHLHDVAARMKAILTSLQGELSAEGPAWGADKFGREFADGDRGYLAQATWVAGSTDAKVELLVHYSENLRTTADSLEQHDRH